MLQTFTRMGGLQKGKSAGGTMPTLVAVGGAGQGSGNITPNLPTGTAQDDILVMFTETGPSEPVQPPSGWFDLGVPIGNGISQLGAFWKRAGSSESAPTVLDSGNHTTAVIVGVRGCITTGSPWDVFITNTNVGNGGTATLSDRISSITTQVANCFVLGAVSANSATASAYFSGWAASGLGSVTEIQDLISASPVRHIGIVTGTKAVAGATGPMRNITLNTANFGGAFMGALMPV